MGCRTSGYGDRPDFTADLSFHVQQERPDGSLWSVEFFLNDDKVFGSKKLFATEEEARKEGWRCLHGEEASE